MVGDPAAIRVEGLTKRYGRRTAVDGLSFTVGSGRVTGFFGPNGAGKTTALKAVVGFARPTAGRAFVRVRPSPRSGPTPACLACTSSRAAHIPVGTVPLGGPTRVARARSRPSSVALRAGVATSPSVGGLGVRVEGARLGGSA
ncbi:ATP-binding cassette domain-containing protein [Streptomyces sp. NPDC005529]|uniref:ATP-binding cassette domain-containing protein n=1 Tax=unclassified Streptomyces TaxID=2593676 RepID=UPI0036CE6E0D